jgi:hypothetical protein
MIAAGRVALEAKTAGRVTLETLMRAALLTMAGRTSIYGEEAALNETRCECVVTAGCTPQ